MFTDIHAFKIGLSLHIKEILKPHTSKGFQVLGIFREIDLVDISVYAKSNKENRKVLKIKLNMSFPETGDFNKDLGEKQLSNHQMFVTKGFQ